MSQCSEEVEKLTLEMARLCESHARIRVDLELKELELKAVRIRLRMALANEGVK